MTRPPASRSTTHGRSWRPPGHVIVLRADGQTFARQHAEVTDERGHRVFALPGQAFGPELAVHAEFDTPGTYQLWGQFRRTDGQVLTAPFTVDAVADGPHARQSMTGPVRRRVSASAA